MNVAICLGMLVYDLMFTVEDEVATIYVTNLKIKLQIIFNYLNEFVAMTSWQNYKDKYIYFEYCKLDRHAEQRQITQNMP